MWNIAINQATCEGEGDCVDVCPVTILSLEEAEAKKVASLTGSAEDCIGCMACVNACPSGSMVVTEE